MIWRRAVKTRILDALRGQRSLRGDIADMQKQIAALQAQLANRVVGGSSNLAGLGLDPPIVRLRLVGGGGLYGTWGAVRIDVRPGDDGEVATPGLMGVYQEDEGDFEYLVEREPHTGDFWAGARVLAVQAWTPAPVGSEPARARYRVLAGETMGFWAEITGAPDSGGFYPWRQVGFGWQTGDPAHPDIYTDTTIPPGEVNPLGKARAMNRHLYDIGITERHEFGAAELVWMWRRSVAGGFVFMGFEEPEYEECA